MLEKEEKRVANSYNNSKKAQVTVFIILAIVIVAGIVLFFVFRGSLFQTSIPSELRPVYDFYLSCVDEEILVGSIILGQQAGYIEQPAFSPGSVYMPFSNQLDFLGVGVPYWYYISGNGIVGEQVPTIQGMEEELEDFIRNQRGCDFSEFYGKGYEIQIEDITNVDVKIKDNGIETSIEQEMVITLEDTSWTSSRHNSEVDSSLGRLYGLAKKIYDYEQENLFLEEYAVDILRLYAPVDGNEITCSPKIWSVDDVRKELIEATEANVPSIKIKNGYYDLSTPDNEYFVQDIGDFDASVNFMYVRDFPLRLEVWPDDGGILKAEPVGLQEGLGILGFCYVPYHFVYDFGFPVLIQLSSETEIFQFPVVVYLDKNVPREAPEVEGSPRVVPELCQNKNTEISHPL